MRRDRWTVGGFVASLIAFAVVGSAPLAAAGTLNGIVLDPQGRVVASASVSVLTGERATVASATTDGEGRFAIADLPTVRA
jgi:hypothetical protein